MKKTMIIIFIMISYSVISLELPKPDNDMMYTEFISTRKATYLKKENISKGIIVMDGQDKFLYKQTMPFEFSIKKTDDIITYKKGDVPEIQLDSDSGNNNEIMVLFGDNETLNEEYDIKAKKNGEVTEFTLTPRKISKIDYIEVFASGDKFKSFTIFFKNKSTLSYEFINTMTGTKPDEKYFK